ncbi:MerR family transcriptional regulator [Actinoplanes sp. NPDC049265]|uniref:DNA polymerase III subunit beta family protein n=1 Tax=Actinoplanes sp. NPDC049265 TaxID=3363902 RepID=UPI0037126F85
MRAIGEMARASGLTASALRFYDRAGVLVPAEVDPVTGYRRYADDQVRAARLVASLRRVGMPIAEIIAAVSALPDPTAVGVLIDRHLHRLEVGLADARRELARARTRLELEVPMTTVTLSAASFAATLSAVRFAVGSDPAILGGVLLETGENVLTMVATDRFRLAVASTIAAVEGPPVRVVLPPEALCGDVTRLTLTPGRVTIEGAEVTPIEGEFPDFRRLVREPEGPRVVVDVAGLRAAVEAQPLVWREHEGSTYPLVILNVDDGVRMASEEEWAADVGRHVAVNRDFLLQALDVGDSGQLVLELDGPIGPLAVHDLERDQFSLLMPVRH